MSVEIASVENMGYDSNSSISFLGCIYRFMNAIRNGFAKEKYKGKYTINHILFSKHW